MSCHLACRRTTKAKFLIKIFNFVLIHVHPTIYCLTTPQFYLNFFSSTSFVQSFTKGSEGDKIKAGGSNCRPEVQPDLARRREESHPIGVHQGQEGGRCNGEEVDRSRSSTLGGRDSDEHDRQGGHGQGRTSHEGEGPATHGERVEGN